MKNIAAICLLYNLSSLRPGASHRSSLNVYILRPVFKFIYLFLFLVYIKCYINICYITT